MAAARQGLPVRLDRAAQRGTALSSEAANDYRGPYDRYTNLEIHKPDDPEFYTTMGNGLIARPQLHLNDPHEAIELVAWSLACLDYRYGRLGRMDILEKRPTMPDRSLAARAYLNERGRPFSAASINSMLPGSDTIPQGNIQWLHRLGLALVPSPFLKCPS
jgi:hypothetical protein